jgi:predicted small lipoprotein YifL
MKYSLKSYCSYFLFFFLSGCGVKGPLFLPPAIPIPSKPSVEEPIGKLYPVDKSSSDQTNSKSRSNSSMVPSDNITSITPTPKK